MPVNLTESSTFTTPVQVPDAGDPVSAGAGSFLRGALQALTNRTKFLGDILTSTGITKVRTVTGSVPLKALTGMADGDLAIISSTSTIGLYRFRLGASLPADIDRVGYNANDATGAWENAAVSVFTALGGAGGTTLQLRQDRLAVPNRVVEIVTTSETSPVFRSVTATGLYDDIGVSVSPSLNLRTGDIVVVEGGGMLTNFSAATFASLTLSVVNPALATVEIAGARKATANISNSGDLVPVHTSGTYVVLADGSHEFKIQVQGPAGNDVRLYRDRMIRATIYRP